MDLSTDGSDAEEAKIEELRRRRWQLLQKLEAESTATSETPTVVAVSIEEKTVVIVETDDAFAKNQTATETMDAEETIAKATER